MKLRDQYDWIVLGDHPAALLSGAMAARLGLSVLALPVGEGVPLASAADGAFLDRETNYLLGLHPLTAEGGGNGLLGQCIARLGLLKSEEDQFLSEGWSPQVLSPDLRFQIQPDPGATFVELRRELGADGERLLREQGIQAAWTRASTRLPQFWSQWPDRLTLETPTDPKGGKGLRAKAVPLTLREFLSRLGRELKGEGRDAQRWFDVGSTLEHRKEEPSGAALYEALCGIWAGLSAKDRSSRVMRAELLHLACLAGSGGAYRGGMSRFREFIRRQGRKYGVHFPERGEAIRIFGEGNRFVGVQSSYRGQMIAAGAGILGVSPERLPESFLERSEKRLARYRKQVRVTGWRFSIAVFVDEKAIPPGMSHRMVWQEADSPALELEWADPADYGIRRPGQAVIFLRTELDYAQATLNREFQRLTAARMLRKLVEIVPFSEYRIARIYPDFRDGTESTEMFEVYPYDELAKIPDGLLVYEGEGLGCVSGLDGLYVASEESYPGMGSVGPVVAAMEAVALLAHQAGLPGPLA